jgi:tripartite-type tricarboxylate transporter receptor subunit TctC
MNLPALLTIALASIATLAHAANAQTYPARPIRLIVAAAPGGGTDFMARAVGQKLSESLGQQVVVDNRPGAGSTIGFELAMKAPPDGYTLLMITPSWAINPSLYPIKFDAAKDYTPIVLVARGPFVIVVNPSVPAHTTRELIALAKAKPGGITYGSSGQGAIVHLATELFLHKAGIRMTHVPYKGGGPALTDLIAGQIQVVFATPQAGLPQVKAGRVRAIAVTTGERLAAAPDIPTVAESGVPDYEVTNWHGLIGPKGLPRGIVEQLNGEVNKAIKAKDLETKLQANGVSAAGGKPEILYELIRKEIVQWHQAVVAAGVKVQ